MFTDSVRFVSGLNPDDFHISIGAICLFAGLVAFFYTISHKPPFPLINEKPKRFLFNARNLIKAGLSSASIFQLNSDNGIKVVLAPKYADELRSDPALSFGGAVEREFHAYIRGFEPFKQGTSSDNIFSRCRAVTEPLSEETDYVLREVWTDSPDWHDLALKSSILRIVAQLSSKVFLGDQICRNPDWLQITVDYTVDAFIAAEELRLWPSPIRPLVAEFLPSCRKIRGELQRAREIITPVLEQRRLARLEEEEEEEEALLNVQGKEKTPGKPKYADAMQWMEDCAKGQRYDPAVAQISFSIAAIHTTSDMLTQVLLDICSMPELINALREEIVTVVQEEGWKKTTFYKLKLMDSVLKESQRLKPTSIGNFKLQDGSVIQKGTFLFVSSERMWDPSVYPDPEKFDPYRFMKLRQVPGYETVAQTVSPSPEHMGFGLGKHACPGRFFAINEVKIALCHILLKYDIALAEGCTSSVRKCGLSLGADPSARLRIRRRREETDLV
ncbi:cytochrome P450 [Aspergillus insuetus]